MDFVRDDDSLDYSLVLEVVRYAFKDEYFEACDPPDIAMEFRDDLRRWLGRILWCCTEVEQGLRVFPEKCEETADNCRGVRSICWRAKTIDEYCWSVIRKPEVLYEY